MLVNCSVVVRGAPIRDKFKKRILDYLLLSSGTFGLIEGAECIHQETIAAKNSHCMEAYAKFLSVPC